MKKWIGFSILVGILLSAASAMAGSACCALKAPVSDAQASAQETVVESAAMEESAVS